MFAQITESVTGEASEAARTVAGETVASVRHIYELLVPSLPTLLGALAILILGWLGAMLVAFAVRMGLRRTGFDRKLAQWCAGEGAEAPKVERAVARGAYYLILVFVLVAFFDTLGLTQVTRSLNDLLAVVLTYIPRVVGASLLLLVAWVVATVMRFVVHRVASATQLDERLRSQVAPGEEKPVAVSKTVANAIYWLVFLLFLPAVLNALALPGLLGPVQEMVTKVLAFLPNLFAAALILGIGWLVARIIQRVTTNLLAAVGTDSLTERVGLSTVMGERRLSEVLGLVVYILVLLPVLVASLNALQLEAVTGPASEMLNMVLTALPAIFAAAVVLVVAYVVGRVVAGLCTNLLTGIGFNSLPAQLGLTRTKEPVAGQRTPSQIAGTLVLVATMLFAVMQALPILGFDLLAGLISEFLVFAGHVLMGLVIFAIGLYLANLAGQVVRSSQIAQANLLALASRVSIIVLAAAMALRQMGLANEIITSAFTIVLGAFAVALALAFGLGGREAAARSLDWFIEARKSAGPTPATTRPQQTGAPTSGTPVPPLEMPKQPGGPFSETGA
ncbi:MAG: mechanosensitive ion channel [Pirellulales bacterium]|nr:mechanosensitive ion channel [Pirellulales bacterium]